MCLYVGICIYVQVPKEDSGSPELELWVVNYPNMGAGN